MLDEKNSLILMIDFQEKLVKATSADKEAENARKAISGGKALGLPIVVSEQYPKGLGNTITSINEVLDDSDVKIEKAAFSLLKEDGALDKIKSFGKKQVVLFGIETHICVLQTALELLENGFEVFVLKNACKSRDESEKASALEYLQADGAKVLTLENMLFQLLRTSKHPKFKEVQALIK